MIIQFFNRSAKGIAAFFSLLIYMSFVAPVIARAKAVPPVISEIKPDKVIKNGIPAKHTTTLKQVVPPKQKFSGGPSQPEMSSFKSLGTNNMVNLFTGDFNYNIPLLDVGGYPVNIFYDGGISPEQEASWVGLGWNVNPGNINRNMRGVPDDFNGNDTLQQMQVMKPNKTWGLGIGGDVELLGIKAPVQANLGVAFNNYLGPSLDLALRGSVGNKIAGSAGSEKSGASAGFNLGIDINSRSGTSFSGGVSLNSQANSKFNTTSMGIGLSTGYNARNGIKALQLSEQVSFNSNKVKQGLYADGWTYDYKAGGHINATLYSTSISFVKPSYIPALRMPITNTAWSGHFQLGLGSYGVAADVEAEVYGQKSEIAPEDILQFKPMVGYLYYQNAVRNPNYVMDFTRFNDKEVTPNTPIISAPQYSFDVFSIQGEGTGGSIRAFRNDLGYVRDNTTTSKDKNLNLGGDIDPPGHFGANVNVVKTPSSIGEWNVGNKLRNTIGFTNASKTFENVYFRNPGENCVIDSNRFLQVGGVDLVRFVIGGTGNSPTIEPKLQSFNSLNKTGTSTIDLSKNATIQARNKRTQVVSFLTAGEASVAGLDKLIKSYNNQQYFDNAADTLLYQTMPRVDGMIRKAHHISQINVTENNGKRFVYGLPVYNTLQKDFTFSVNNTNGQVPDKIQVSAAQFTSNSTLLADSSSSDGYVQVTTTPAYAHSFLLSGILSPDYVDVTDNGITEDDLGEATKFNYSRIKNGTDSIHRWRSPLSANDTANFNPGTRSEQKDDKGIISYGERESWYLQSIESKNMIALFYLGNRADGKGAIGADGGVKHNDYLLKRLDSIALYSKSDLRNNGLSKAKAIKTVHFGYSYKLCVGTPDNDTSVVNLRGKLTLDTIYFTYNGKTRAFKNNYRFVYNSTGSDNTIDNPTYNFQSASDRWGTFKPESMNPGGLKNSDYPYSAQDSIQKAQINQNASAWMLKKIILPSGGQIDLTYESDDYAYVQDRRAATMMKIVGFGSTSTFSAATDRLYPIQNGSQVENDYVFVQVPKGCKDAREVYNLYLQGVKQLAFKIWVFMPKGGEFIPCYANFSANNYGVVSGNNKVIWIKMERLGGKSPVSVTALEYLRQNLPGQAFTGYDVKESQGLKQIGDMLAGMLQSLKNAFKDPINAFRSEGKAQRTDLNKSFVRLNDPDGIKYGGGHRVKSVMLKDNWNAMTGQYTASYGQNYDYTTVEKLDSTWRRISSGVASYEPSIGGEENPFQSILQVEDYLPAGPTSYGAVEMPMLDAFFPSPVVGYSKVTVSAIKLDTSALKKSRSGIGKQVTEYFTAKDFPVNYNYTPFDVSSVKEFHQASTLAFFNKYAYDFKALSQGFLVATNDMHGKVKSQSSYAENDTSTRISYTENFYKNTGANGMNDKFNFINKDNSGSVFLGNMGVDVDLMTDAREFSVKSNSVEVQAQVDIFYTIVPFPVPTAWPVFGVSENTYRAVTTTKVVNYHSVLDSVVVIDKGSQVSTKNLAYDAQTGEVIVTRTNNEFNQPVYNTSYPAYWAYGGMGLAYKNIDAVFAGISFSDGKLTTAGFDFSAIESGDEILITNTPTAGSGCDALLTSGAKKIIWAIDKNKNISSLTIAQDFIFMDSKGIPYTNTNVNFRVIRSGKRNMLDAKNASISGMDNPLATGKLLFNTTSKITNATAVEYKEKFLADNDVFNRLRLVKNLTTCEEYEVPDTLGYLEKKINPYKKGLLGNFRTYRSLVFYDTRKEYDTAITTNIIAYGYLNNFKPYWDFNGSSNLVPDNASTQWVWNSKLNRVNAKGLELETVDALGIYSSALYGFNKSVPFSMASNARYSEMFAEGFEDYSYGESINNTNYNFLTKHIDLQKLPNTFLVNTDTTNFRAHTGKFVLGLNAAPSAMSIPILAQPDTALSPSFVFQKDTVKVLNTIGGTYSFLGTNPKIVPVGNQGTPTFSSTNPSVFLTIMPLDTLSGGNRQHYYSQSGYFYINISAASTYTFNMGMGTAYNNTGATVFSHSNGFTVSLTDTLGNVVSDYLLSQVAYNYTSGTYNVFLCPGIYKVNYSTTESYFATYNGTTGTQNTYTWSCSNSTSPDYLNLAKINGCIYTRSMPATDAMKNPAFSLPAGKKMFFSAWVRELCGDISNGIPCKEYTYTHNQVQLKFGGSPINDAIMNPAGPIIDGWQRYEGVFTPPVGATIMSLNLVNSSTGKIYFDDIRIHPFNSNMTSYVYDPISLRLVAQLDANNYASFYEYDEEGVLIRTKAETKEGIKTISETRSALQKQIR